MASYRYATRPPAGKAIACEHGVLGVPAHPVIPYVDGDGAGPDTWRTSVRVFDAAIQNGVRLGAHGQLREGVRWRRSPRDAWRVALARQMPGATKVSTSSFGDENIKGMGA